MADFKRVLVEWIDANGETETWTAEKDFPKPVLFTSVGWLVKQEVDYIVLAGTIQVSELDAGEAPTYGDVSAYPMEMVRDIREV
jgi:hypothetical protein